MHMHMHMVVGYARVLSAVYLQPVQREDEHAEPGVHRAEVRPQRRAWLGPGLGFKVRVRVRVRVRV